MVRFCKYVLSGQRCYRGRRCSYSHDLSLDPDAARRERIARELSNVLRHQGKKLGLSVRTDGYIEVQDLLALDFFRSEGVTADDLRAVVDENEKKRFTLAHLGQPPALYIRAAQGHTMTVVEDAELLVEIRCPEELPVCVHGTYLRRWDSKEGVFVFPWARILRLGGLSPMGRNHIHFVPSDEPPGGDPGVVSGMRSDCQVAVYVDVRRAMT